MSGDIVPETRAWQAFEAEPNEAGGHFLSVSGEIKLANANETPHLILADPQPPTSGEILLELKVISEGTSRYEWQWKQARILYPVTSGQYGMVRVIWQGVEVVALHLAS